MGQLTPGLWGAGVDCRKFTTRTEVKTALSLAEISLTWEANPLSLKELRSRFGNPSYWG
jgi:hypothetical protein